MQNELMPVNQNVILDVAEKGEQKTASGIIIPDSAKQKPKFAKVISISNINFDDNVDYLEYEEPGTHLVYLTLPYDSTVNEVRFNISNIENIEIAVGDTVYFNEYAGSNVEFEGKNYLVVPYSEILAKVVEMEAI